MHRSTSLRLVIFRGSLLCLQQEDQNQSEAADSHISTPDRHIISKPLCARWLESSREVGRYLESTRSTMRWHAPRFSRPLEKLITRLSSCQTWVRCILGHGAGGLTKTSTPISYASQRSWTSERNGIMLLTQHIL